MRVRLLLTIAVPSESGTIQVARASLTTVPTASARAPNRAVAPTTELVPKHPLRSFQPVRSCHTHSLSLPPHLTAQLASFKPRARNIFMAGHQLVKADCSK